MGGFLLTCSSDCSGNKMWLADTEAANSSATTSIIDPSDLRILKVVHHIRCAALGVVRGSCGELQLPRYSYLPEENVAALLSLRWFWIGSHL